MFFENKKFKTRRRRTIIRPKLPIETLINVLLEIAEKLILETPIKLGLAESLRIGYETVSKIITHNVFDEKPTTQTKILFGPTAYHVQAQPQLAYGIDLTSPKTASSWVLAPFSNWLDHRFGHKVDLWTYAPFKAQISSNVLREKDLWFWPPFSVTFYIVIDYCLPISDCETKVGICYDGPMPNPCPTGYCRCLPKY